MFNLTPLVRNLLIINVAIFLLQSSSPYFFDWFALHPLQSSFFQPHQFVTYMFLHSGFGHLFSNMLGLFFFGPMVEQNALGTRKFLIMYFVTGIGAGLLHTGINYFELSQMQQALQTHIQYPSPDTLLDFLNRFAPAAKPELLDFINDFEDHLADPAYIQTSTKTMQSIYQANVDIPMVGASGSIFGIMATFALVFPNLEMMLLFFPIPIKAKYFVTFYAAYELYAGIYQRGSGVAHFAHVGGAVFAYLLIRYWGIRRLY
jgi:membrane associated rhomboid family serine protease